MRVSQIYEKETERGRKTKARRQDVAGKEKKHNGNERTEQKQRR